jgi:uncharacterized phage protein (TIGR02220 family)
MARPKSNNADYYFHAQSMRHHRKVKMVRNKFGSVLGYAFWCMMLEWLIEHDGLEWENSEIEVEMFASELGISTEEVLPIIDYCIKIGLLSRTDSDFIYSESLHENMQPLFEKRNRERERSKDRKRKEDGTFSSKNPTTQVISAAETPRSIVKESIVKENTITNTPVSQGQKEIFESEKPAEISIAEKEKGFIELFNKITDRNFKTLDPKTKTNFKNLLKEGYRSIDFKNAISAALKEMKKRDTVSYLTPEFIARPAEFSKYVNMAPLLTQSQQPQKPKLQT